MISAVCADEGDERGYFVLPFFFKASRMSLHPKKMRDERLLLLYNFFVGKAVSSCIFGRAVKGFFSVQFFRQGRVKPKSNYNLTKWLTTIEQFEVAK